MTFYQSKDMFGYNILYESKRCSDIQISLSYKAEKPVGEAPTFVSELSPGVAVEDERYKLTCKVSGVPEPTVSWLKNDLEVPLDDRVKYSFDGQVTSLIFKNLTLEDTGKYTCVVKNDFGSVVSSADVVVKMKSKKPEIISKMKDAELTEGENAHFEVKVKGNPTPDVQWFRGKNRIKSEGSFAITKSDEDQTYTLRIKDVKVDDAGVYKCVASNEAGSTPMQAKLSVKEKKVMPEFEGPDYKAPFALKENEKLSVDLKIKGKPKPDVTWFKDGIRLRESRNLRLSSDKDTYNLNIPKVTPEDAGTYKCEAKNDVGKASRTFEVEVEGK